MANVPSAAVRVLDREPSGAFRISYESPADLDMYARDCEITVADLDGDGSKDVFMELLAGKGSYAWMFRGVGTTLEPLQKIKGNPGLVDLYHDGSQQVEVVADVDYYSGDHVRVWLELYKVTASGVVLDSPVLALGTFEPGDTVFSVTTYSTCRMA
jgi:hypothetical protein